MGGIADYSGSLVLQWPIREATLAAVQAVTEPGLKIVSLAVEDGHEPRSLALDPTTTADLLEGGYEQARHWFGAIRPITGRPTSSGSWSCWHGNAGSSSIAGCGS